MTAEGRDEILARITPDRGLRRRQGRRPRDRGRLRGSDAQEVGVRRGRAAARAGRAAGLEHLDAADHRPRRGRGPAGGLHRPALLLAGRQDAAGGDHRRREDLGRRRWPRRSTSPCRSARPRSWSTTAAASSPAGSSARSSTRRQRCSARVFPPQSIEQAALQAGYPVGPLAADRRGEPDARPEDQAGGPGGGGGDGDPVTRVRRTTRAMPVIEKLVAEHRGAAGPPGRASTTTPRASASGCGRASTEAFGGQNHGHPVPGPPGAHALHRGDREHQVPRRERPAHGAGRQHRLDLRHRLPGVDRWRAAVRQRLRRRGPAGFVARANELAEKYGERFTPPASVVALAESGGSYK